MYSLVFKASVRKELRQVPKQYLQSILFKIETLSAVPRPVGVKLLRGEGRYYRIRHGDYRIIFDIDDTHAVVTILAVGHRREVYDV